MSSEKIPPEPDPISSASEAAERLATIVNAAEQAAASVIDAAEREASRRLEEAGARADKLVAARLRELADELDPPGGAEAPKPRLRSVEPPADRDEGGEDWGGEPLASPAETEAEAKPAALRPLEGSGNGAGGRRAGSAGARLLATQMAVSGASREEIATRLRSGFEIDDTEEILDAILGPER